MAFKLRQYQSEAITAGANFFKSNEKKNGILVLPTGSGKSVVIANLIAELSGMVVILQPSKEILEQNFEKYTNYGFPASIYSASIGEKKISRVVFATIGSIFTKKQLFKRLKYIIVDECHLINAKDGMYKEFLQYHKNAKVLGLTATPYRLESTSLGPELKFITRTEPKLFHDVLYYVQNSVLFDSGFLAKLEYYQFDVVDRKMIPLNSTGTDFDEKALKSYYKKIDMPSHIVKIAFNLLKKRKNLLIFCALTDEAKIVVKNIPGAVLLTSETKKDEREKILFRFKKGLIKCLVNVGVLTTGFDYPELECVLIARSTMSLSLYYQIVGRAMRIHPNKKESWIVDLGGNIAFFGKIETMKIEVDTKGRYAIFNNGKQLTNAPFER